MKHLDFTADGVEVSKYMCLVSSQGHSKEMIADLFPKVKDPHGKRGITHGFFPEDHHAQDQTNRSGNILPGKINSFWPN
jgi:hypothetical protein